jgi:hypothetical protein
MKRFKKALAIICAGAMAFTAMPLQVFAMPWGTAAAIDIALSGVPRRVPGRTVFFEPNSPGGTHGGQVVDGFVVTLPSGIPIRTLEGVPGTDGIGSLHADADFFAEAPYLQLAIPRAHAMDFLHHFDSAGVDLVLQNAVWNYHQVNNAPNRPARPINVFVDGSQIAYHATDNNLPFARRTLVAGGLASGGTVSRNHAAFGNLNRSWSHVYGPPGSVGDAWDGFASWNSANPRTNPGINPDFQNWLHRNSHPFSIAFPGNNSDVAYLMIHNLARVVEDTEVWADAQIRPAYIGLDLGVAPAFGFVPAIDIESPQGLTEILAAFAAFETLVEAVETALDTGSDPLNQAGFTAVQNALLDVYDALFGNNGTIGLFNVVQGIIDTNTNPVLTEHPNFLQSALTTLQNFWVPLTPGGFPEDRSDLETLTYPLDVAQLTQFAETITEANLDLPGDPTPPPTTTGTTAPPTSTTAPPTTNGTTAPPTTNGTTAPPTTNGTTAPPTTNGTTAPPTTNGTTAPPTTNGTTAPPVEAPPVNPDDAPPVTTEPNTMDLLLAALQRIQLLLWALACPCEVCRYAAGVTPAFSPFEGEICRLMIVDLEEGERDAAFDELQNTSEFVEDGLPLILANPNYADLEGLDVWVSDIEDFLDGIPLSLVALDVILDDLQEEIENLIDDAPTEEDEPANGTTPPVTTVPPTTAPTPDGDRGPFYGLGAGLHPAMTGGVGVTPTAIHNVDVWTDDYGFVTHIILSIPMVTRTTLEDAGNAVVSLRNQRNLTLPAISDVVFATTVTGGTEVRIHPAAGSVRQPNLHTLNFDVRVRELVGGALPVNGAIEFEAPRGFVWSGWIATPHVPGSTLDTAVRNVQGDALMRPDGTTTFTGARILDDGRVLRIDYENLNTTGAGRPPAYLDFFRLNLRAEDVDNPPTGSIEIRAFSGRYRSQTNWAGGQVHSVRRVQPPRWEGASSATPGFGWRPGDAYGVGNERRLMVHENVNMLDMERPGISSAQIHRMRTSYINSWARFSHWVADTGGALPILPDGWSQEWLRTNGPFGTVSWSAAGIQSQLSWADVYYWHRYPWGPGLRQPREIYYVTLDFGAGATGGTRALSTLTPSPDPFTITLHGRALEFYTVGDDVPTLISGRFEDGFMPRATIDEDEHLAARVRIRETVRNAWSLESNTVLVLPEGVHVRAARVVPNGQPANANNLQGLTNSISGNVFYNTNNPDNYLRVNNNTVTFTGLERTYGATASGVQGHARITVDLYLSIEADFEGDIYAHLEDSRGNIIHDGILIAEAIPPVRVYADINHVRVGDQFVSVGGFRIVENVAGGLLAGHEVFLSLADEVFSELHLVPAHNFNANRDVVVYPAPRDGGLELANVSIHNLIGGFQHGRDQAHISFEIDRASTVPSTIEFDNLMVRVAAVTPNNATYDLFVWGPAVASNFNHHAIFGENSRFPALPSTAQFNAAYGALRASQDGESLTGGFQQLLINRRDLFFTPGIRAPFAQVGQGGGLVDTVPTIPYTIVIPIGSSTITVGEREVGISPVALIDGTGTGMFPLRAISEALGLPVNWCPISSTAFIGHNSEIEFVSGSTMMRVNGNPMPIRNGAGIDVSATIINESMFIPLRALGYAMNMTVEWDAANNTAILRP